MYILGKNIHNKLETKLTKFKLFSVFIILSIIAFVIDQFTKYLIFKNLNRSDVIEILPFFNIRFVYNTGISFSMLNGGGKLTHGLLIILPLLISLVLIIWMLKDKTVIHTISTAIIVGGAMGNLLDRFHYVGVIDFLDFYWGHSHYPTFNSADSFIFIGAVLIFIRPYL